MPDVVRRAIEGRLQAEEQRERERAQLRRAEVIAPFMQNVEIAQAQPRNINPMNRTLENTNLLARDDSVRGYMNFRVMPVRPDSPNERIVSHYEFGRPPRG